MSVSKNQLKIITSLSQKKYRQKHNLFVAEGIKVVNELIKSSMDELTNEEGCLSLPGHYADVSRPATARVKYIDENGCQQIIDTDGLLAVCIQHEIDHINGILFVDHLSSLKRNMILKKMVKAKKER